LCTVFPLRGGITGDTSLPLRRRGHRKGNVKVRNWQRFIRRIEFTSSLLIQGKKRAERNSELKKKPGGGALKGALSIKKKPLTPIERVRELRSLQRGKKRSHGLRTQ